MTTTRLPFTLDPLPGEDAHTYLASYAFHLTTTVEALASELGFTRARGTRRLTKPTSADHPRLTASITAATRLDQAAVTALLTAPAHDRPLCANAVAFALRTDPPLLEPTGSSPVAEFVRAATAELDGANRLEAHDRLGDLFLITAHIDAPENGPSFAARALSAHATPARLAKALRILNWQHTETATDPLTEIDPRLTTPRPGPEPIPRSWQTASPTLARRIARLLGTGLHVAARLRHATTAARTRSIPRNPDPAERAARLPDQLWPAWAIRLTEEEGVNNTYFRAHLAAAMLLPGARTDLADLARVHGHETTAPGISHQLRRLAATPGGEQALSILTELALAIDREHVPINYARRRAVFASCDLIDADTCANLLKDAGLKPGGTRRLELIRTYLYETLTGASHATAPEPYRIRKGFERNDYLEFTTTMPASLVAALTRHARTLLAEHGIDEPLDWQPPTEWAGTTDLPGTDPDATDPGTIHQAVLARWAATTEHWAPTHEDAATLGISLEHLRYVLRRHPLPHAPYTQHYAGAVIADPDATVPFRAHPGPDAPGRVYYIDPSWLHQQYTNLGRTVADLANQIGCTKATLRNHIAAHEYPMRSRGTGAYLRPGTTTTDPAELPELLRAALAGPKGAQRVRRFLTITEHPSLNQAAAALGIPQNALTTQLKALEQRCGARLLHRSPQPTPIGPLTKHGEQLCEQARQHLPHQPQPPDG